MELSPQSFLLGTTDEGEGLDLVTDVSSTSKLLSPFGGGAKPEEVAWGPLPTLTTPLRVSFLGSSVVREVTDAPNT